ncbi:MAG: segregation/condensation protein A [Lachnospiraceae bacterium]|nr:segregation/condensation protein A [Lachnospiraceae bacterium]
MSISVKLEAFEGPLDLLLHLIEKNKVNIYDIPIVMITEQYMEYMKQLEAKDMEVMSEFLVMAATLLKIKSKMLLPSEEEEEEEEDPRAELVERLLEYKMFKYMSYELKDRQIDASKLIFKEPTLPDEVADYKEEVDLSGLLSDVTLTKLHSIFKSVIKKQVDKIDPIRSKFGTIEKEEVNQADKMLFIESYAIAQGTFSFRKFLESQKTKMDVIVSFLCLLELMKLGHLKIVQENIFDDILITYVKKEDRHTNLEEITEELEISGSTN